MGTAKEIVIVTGASGFIGSQVVNHLAKTFQVVGFDKIEPAHATSGAEFVHIDLTSDQSVKNSLEYVRYRYGDWITSVVHLAADSEIAGSPSQTSREITVNGTDRLLRGLQRFRVEQLVFSSSISVYAPTVPGQPIDEASPVVPKWGLPKSKVQTERLISERRGDIQTAFLRIAGVYDDLCQMIPLAGQMRRIYERQLVSRVYPGDASHGQPFIHLDDLVDAVARVIERRWELPPEVILILGESETVSYKELQSMFGRLIHDEEWRTNEIPKSIAKVGTWLDDRLGFGGPLFIEPWMIDFADDHYELDISRARALLGWQPNHSLRNTLPKMVSALKSDAAGWYRANKLEIPSWMGDTTDTSPEKAHAC